MCIHTLFDSLYNSITESIILSKENQLMTSLIQELRDIEDELKSFVIEATDPKITDALNTLENRAKAVGRAWSGSWISYQACVYYENLQPPPPGRHFSSEWGFIDAFLSGTNGAWREFDPDIVKNEIEEQTNQQDIERAVEFAQIGKELFDDKRDQIVSILETSKLRYNGSFLDDLFVQTRDIVPGAAAQTHAFARLAVGSVATPSPLARSVVQSAPTPR
jgi:hypothetical protein